jgi:5-formyltetrahydrofolate cyclo-ligase
MSPRPDGKLTTHERAKAANAALTTEQRSAAGKARAAALHHPVTLARRIAKAWPELSDEDRRAVRRELRRAGVIA